MEKGCAIFPISMYVWIVPQRGGGGGDFWFFEKGEKKIQPPK